MWYRLYAYSWNVDQDAIASWLKANAYRTVKIKKLKENSYSMAIIQFKFRTYRDAMLFRLFHSEIETKKLSTVDYEWKIKINQQFSWTGANNKINNKIKAMARSPNSWLPPPNSWLPLDFETFDCVFSFSVVGKFKQKKQKHRC